MALLVVWSHAFEYYYGTQTAEPVSLLLNGYYNAGNLAVCAFFAISGFLISQSWDRLQSWPRYLRKRIARIFPGYLVAVLVCSIFVVPLFSSRSIADYTPNEWIGIASNVWLRNYIVPSNAFGGENVNGSLWSIPYEFWCYLGIMTLGLVGLWRQRWLFPALALTIMLARIAFDFSGALFAGGRIGAIFGYPYFWCEVAPPFLLGATVYHFREVIPRRKVYCGILIVVLLLACRLPTTSWGHDIAGRLVFPVALSYTIFLIAFSPIKLFDAARFGDFSYGTYLYGAPIQLMLFWTYRGEISFAAYVALSLSLSVFAGAVSWYLIERHFVVKPRTAKANISTQGNSGNR
jgi:peptidoglycan/LPS O-acetylase OafA/YrhL